MNKQEYLNELRKNLKRLPEQEINDALEYYTEYLEEAGPENEATVLEELGSPKELARKIIIEAVDKEFSEDNEEDISEGDKKEKSHNSIWTILLAILAIPMSPVVVALLLALYVLFFAVLITLAALILAFAITSVAGILVFIAGLIALFINPGIGFSALGAGLIIISLFAIFTILVIKLTKITFVGIKRFGGKIVHRKAGKKK